jgi:hypothetical protein
MIFKFASLSGLAVLSAQSVTVEAAAAASGDKDKMHGVLKEVVLKGVHSSASVRNLQKNEGKKNQQKGKKTSRPTYSPTAESIVCVNGIHAASGVSCKIACDGQCCKDPDDDLDPCDSFTGTVRKDGKSCMGYQACTEGNIKSVTNSCNGYQACYNAGAIGGVVGDLTNACNDYEACLYAGYSGKVGDLTDACNDVYACYEAGSSSGVVGDLTNACNDFEACTYAGYDGEVGDLTNACNGVYACTYAGYDGGVVDNLKNCCNNGYQVCFNFQNDVNFPAACRLTESPTKAPTKSPVKASKTNKLVESSTNPTNPPNLF